MLRARALLVFGFVCLLTAGCVEPPRKLADKEVFVEPFRDAEYELARLNRTVAFPIAPSEQPRAYSFARAFSGEDERFARTQMLLAGSKDEPEAAKDAAERPDPTKLEKPPTTLIFPDRIDARATSGCYLGHCTFLDQAGTSVVHHLRLLVVNRERTRITVPVSSFTVFSDPGDGKNLVPLPLLVATTDRAVKIPSAMEVPPGEERLAHFFYSERARLSTVLSVRWSASVEDARGQTDHDVAFRGELVRRYIAKQAPISYLEDRVARGKIDFPDPIGTRDDWTDPGLSAVPGAGK